MLDSEQTGDGAATGVAESAATETPKKTTRRRRTTKAAPAAAEPASVSGDAADPAEAATPAKAAPAKTTRRRAASRRATSDAASPADAADTDTPNTDTADTPAAAAPPVKARPRKTTAKAARVAAEPTSTSTSTSDASPAAEAPAAEPVKATRTPRARKAAAPPTLTFMAPPEPAPTSAAAPPTDSPAETPAKATGRVSATKSATKAASAKSTPAKATRSRRTQDTDAAETEPQTTATQADPSVSSRPDDPAEAEHAPETDHKPGTDQGEEDSGDGTSRRRRRGRRGRGRTGQDGAVTEHADDQTPEHPAEQHQPDAAAADDSDSDGDDAGGTSRRRRRRRRRSGSSDDGPDNGSSGAGTGVVEDEVQGVKGSTRLEAKRQRRRDGRDQGRRRPPILSEAEFLARRESVDRTMAVRQHGERTQIAVLEDEVLVEHYVTKATSTSYAGNVYLGRVQNVLPSMEAAFIDIGKGRNAVLYAGEVNWDEAGLGGRSRSIEQALRSGDSVLVQVSKDPIGHKGARLTSQISLPGRYLVYVPGGSMTGISRKLPDVERTRLKSILRKIVPDDAGVIIRTAAEGASEEELTRDVTRLQAQWETLSARAEKEKSSAPVLLHAEPDLAIRVVRDIFNEDFASLIVSGAEAWETVGQYVDQVAPDLRDRLHLHTGESNVFADLRVDEQLAKALDRKVWLPSGGSLVIDRTEAMTVIDVNTGRYTGQGGNLEETVTRNNLEAAEEIVRQLRLRDIGGMIVIDFIDMVLESNRELVLRRLTECLGRDRTRHQVAEVTSLGLVQMTRKRVGQGLLEAFSEPCEHCNGRGVIVHTEPVETGKARQQPKRSEKSGRSGKKGDAEAAAEPAAPSVASTAIHAVAAATLARAESDEHGNGQPDEATAAAAAESAGPTAVESAPERPTAVESAPQQAAAVEPAVTARPRRGRRRAAVREAGPPEHVVADA